MENFIIESIKAVNPIQTLIIIGFILFLCRAKN